MELFSPLHNTTIMNDLDSLLADIGIEDDDDTSSSFKPTTQSYQSTYQNNNNNNNNNNTTTTSNNNTNHQDSYTKSNNEYKSEQSTYTKKSHLDPLDDLLSFCEEDDDEMPSSKSSNQNNYSTSSSHRSKPINSMSKHSISNSENGGNSGSSQILIGGSNCKLNNTPSKFGNIINDRLLCTKCMCEVVRFADYHWDKDVDYMFFRNFWPEPERLGPKLKSRTAWAAYCCQCSWTSVRDIEEVKRDLKWVVPKN